jgi:hypothetical protein
MATAPTATTIRCVRCGAEFGCDPAGACWCKEEAFRLPMPSTTAQSCLCPKCLREAAQEAAQ